MSTLAVIAYPEQSTAGEAAAALARMQKEFLIELEDVAWVTKAQDGKLKLHQGTSLTGAGAAGGAMWGFLFGLLFLVPIAGMAIGAASGALAGHLSDYGMDDKWIKEVAGVDPTGRLGALCDGAQHQPGAGVAGDGQVRRHRAQDQPHERAAAGARKRPSAVGRLKRRLPPRRGSGLCRPRQRPVDQDRCL